MRIPRLTVRALMMAVLMVALILGGLLGFTRLRLGARYAERADQFSRLASESKAYGAEWSRRAARESDPVAAKTARGHARDYLEHAAWTGAMAKWFRDGARRNPPRLGPQPPTPASLMPGSGQVKLVPPPLGPIGPAPPEPE
jgi:hypothetical protein